MFSSCQSVNGQDNTAAGVRVNYGLHFKNINNNFVGTYLSKIKISERLKLTHGHTDNVIIFVRNNRRFSRLLLN